MVVIIDGKEWKVEEAIKQFRMDPNGEIGMNSKVEGEAEALEKFLEGVMSSDKDE